MNLLQTCNHPHLLPLLDHCLDKEAPCLIFPLKRGGSLEHRLRPTAPSSRQSLSRLGLKADPKPLTWRQRLRIMMQAIDALVYLHTATPGKPSIVHCDFKPGNILLDEGLQASLADTGFAKATKAQEADGATSATTTLMTTTTGFRGFSAGFADKLIMDYGGEMTPLTDGYAATRLPHMHIRSRSTGPLLSPPHHGRYAVGVTLLICLTNRHPEGIFHACETEHDEDFEEVAASKLADPRAGFPAAVAGKLRDIVKCNGKCLCHDKERKRLDLPSVLEAMHEILSPTAGPLVDAPPPAASAESPGLSQPSTTVLLSQIGREAVANKQEEAERRLQRHAVNGFNDFMRMLERSYGTAAPELTTCDQVRCACQPHDSL